MTPYIVKWQSNGMMVKTFHCVDEVEGSNPIDPIRIFINLSHKGQMGYFHVVFSHWSACTNQVYDQATCHYIIGLLVLYDHHITFPVIRTLCHMTLHCISTSVSYWLYGHATCHPCSGEMCHLDFEFLPSLTKTLPGHNFSMQNPF